MILNLFSKTLTTPFTTHRKGFGVRYGRLAEIMDFMAGRVAYAHCYAQLNDTNPGFTIVTASCDHFEFYPTPLSLKKNMTMEVKSYKSNPSKSFKVQDLVNFFNF